VRYVLLIVRIDLLNKPGIKIKLDPSCTTVKSNMKRL